VLEWPSVDPTTGALGQQSKSAIARSSRKCRNAGNRDRWRLGPTDKQVGEGWAWLLRDWLPGSGMQLDSRPFDLEAEHLTSGGGGRYSTD